MPAEPLPEIAWRSPGGAETTTTGRWKDARAAPGLVRLDLGLEPMDAFITFVRAGDGILACYAVRAVDSESPEMWAGGRIRSFCSRHGNFIREEDYRQLNHPKAPWHPYLVELSCYQHGGVQWGLPGEVQQCEFDTARRAGWYQPDADTVDECVREARKGMGLRGRPPACRAGTPPVLKPELMEKVRELLVAKAREFCRLWSAWVDDEIFDFVTELYPAAGGRSVRGPEMREQAWGVDKMDECRDRAVEQGLAEITL